MKGMEVLHSTFTINCKKDLKFWYIWYFLMLTQRTQPSDQRRQTRAM